MPRPAGYTTFVSRTDPRTQFRIDPDMKAPYTDQFSLGVDREIAKNLGVGVNFVRKNGGNQLGWVDTGGVYGTQNVVINGQNITLFPLLNAPSARSFLRTNGPGYYNRLHGAHPDRDAPPGEPLAVHRRLHPPEVRGARTRRCRRGPWCK